MGFVVTHISYSKAVEYRLVEDQRGYASFTTSCNVDAIPLTNKENRIIFERSMGLWGRLEHTDEKIGVEDFKKAIDMDPEEYARYGMTLIRENLRGIKGNEYEWSYGDFAIISVQDKYVGIEEPVDLQEKIIKRLPVVSVELLVNFAEERMKITSSLMFLLPSMKDMPIVELTVMADEKLRKDIERFRDFFLSQVILKEDPDKIVESLRMEAKDIAGKIFQISPIKELIYCIFENPKNAKRYEKIIEKYLGMGVPLKIINDSVAGRYFAIVTGAFDRDFKIMVRRRRKKGR